MSDKRKPDSRRMGEMDEGKLLLSLALKNESLLYLLSALKNRRAA